MTSDHDRPSETQAVNELVMALHTVRSGCSQLCAIAPPLGHEEAGWALFQMGWRPPWWFHNPDGSLNGRPPVPYDPPTGRAR